MSQLFLQVMDTRLRLLRGTFSPKAGYLVDFKREIPLTGKETIPEILAIFKDAMRAGGLEKKGFRPQEIQVLYGKSGLLYRNVKLPFMPLEDLDKMMELEIGEFLSIPQEEYETRYQITDTFDENGQIYWNIGVAGVERQKLLPLIHGLDQMGLLPVRVDILPVNYQRFFGSLDSPDIMILENDGKLSRICMLKAGQVFLYADFPIDNQNLLDTGIYDPLLLEIRGYMEYYASRNFGKTMDSLLLLGDYFNPILQEAVERGLSLPMPAGEALLQGLLATARDLSPLSSPASEEGQLQLATHFYGPLSMMKG